jgi:hypothetical protein
MHERILYTRSLSHERQQTDYSIGMSRSDVQEILIVFNTPKVQYPFHKSSLRGPTLGQMNPVRTLTSYFFLAVCHQRNIT